MNYELKTVQPGSVFANAIRIFIIVGFLVAVLSFFVIPNPSLALQIWWQKILATLLFTVVYAVVVSGVLALIAFLYNLWTQSFPGIKVHFEQTEE
jgi:hypothetical protein